MFNVHYTIGLSVIFTGHPLATTMNETITILSEALSTMMSPLSPLGGGIGAAVAGNETGKVVPVPSSRACGAWNTGQHNLFQTAEVALILGSLVPHRSVNLNYCHDYYW